MHSKERSLTSGPVVKGLVLFLIPLMLGQFLQQLYNVADAWVIGNFTDNTSFAAVSSCGNLSFLIVGFFTGLSNGAGVVIARHFGANDDNRLVTAMHTTILFGIISSIVITIITTLLTPSILTWMQTPENVLPYAIQYFRVYCMGISTVIMYNMFMAIMRALGDSLSPLIFLCISSVTNVGLDLLLVAVLHQGVFGAALATVLSQGMSAILCFIKMERSTSYLHVYLHKLKIDIPSLKDILMQGLPSGLQNSALSIGNVVIQSNINSFGEYAMAGQGAHAKIEGFVFIPIISISMALATFISQNRGAGNWDRVKKGSVYATVCSLVIAQIIGFIMYAKAPTFLGIFTDDPQSIQYGICFTRLITLFYIPLAFTHAASGIMQGLGKSIYAMSVMLGIWCIVRIIYVTIALHIKHKFVLICWAYPITWMLSSSIFIILLWYEWRKIYGQRKQKRL